MQHTPIDDLERFDVMRALFPDEITDDDDGWEKTDELIESKFDCDPETFDLIVGHLIRLAPVHQSPLTGKLYHVLGTISITENAQSIIAAVQRAAVPATGAQAAPKDNE